jgi:cytidine deaminase
MKKIQFSAEYLCYADEKGLPDQDKMLLNEAKEAVNSSYSPYSKFKVGAALLLENGAVVRGSNQENAAFPVTLCAERTAVFSAAVQFPGVAIVAIAVTVETQQKNMNKPITPCGSCRQVMLEYELRFNHNIRIIMQGDFGEIYIAEAVKDIVPLYFDASFL